MQLNKSLKPTTDTNGALINKQDYAALSREINELKEQIQALQTAIAGFANTVNTDNLNAVNVTADNVAGENIQAQDLSATNTLSVSNGSGQDKEIIINRNGVPRWETADQINAQEVLVADTVWRATTVDHSGSVNTTDAVTQADSVTHADSVDHADNVTTLDSATTVNHADTIVDADNVTGADTVASAAIVTSANTVDSASTVTGATTVDSASTVTGATTVDHADTVTDADVATNVTTATNISTVENVTTCDTVTNTTTVTNADTVTDADTVAHADIVQVADVIQQIGDASIVGNLAVTGDITQGNDTLDNTYIKLTEKGTANGVATLDNTGRIPASQLTIDAMEYKGKWDASTNTPTLADGTGTDGDFYIVSVAGSQDLGSGTISFNLNDRVLYNGSEWERVPAGQVDSVNGATGDVVLTGEDIAESSGDSLSVDRRLRNWLFVIGQGANSTKEARGYFSGSGVAFITFDADNVYQGAFSLTINGVTLPVYLNGVVTSITNYTLPKGTYLIKAQTNYYYIETTNAVDSAREAGHATGADYAYLSFNKLYTCSTSASTTNKSITLPLTANDLANNPIEFMCKFVYGNTNSNARLLINGTTFDYAINGAVRSASNYKWDAGTYRITLVGGRAYINPYSPQRLGGLSDVTSSVTTSAGYTADKNGFLWGTITAASANDAIFFLSITHDGTAIPVDVLRWRISKSLYNSFCIPVSVGDVVKIDTATNVYQEKFYMQAWG